MERQQRQRWLISIHAPPRGATRRRRLGSAGKLYFNSRPSARGDARDCGEAGHVCWHFNSRPSARGDTSNSERRKTMSIFQFTPLREGRRSGIVTLRGITNDFNSRPSARGDRWCTHRYCLPCNFNSRPSARGDGKRYAISANLLFNPYKSAWLNNSATQFVEIILVIFHRIIA